MRTMITRLKVSGFKNLVDVDVRFGPFTCIAGANGVGKSNLFDAIKFLSALADMTLLEAALSVRDNEKKSGDIQGIFHRVGEHFDDEIKIEAEMIVPSKGIDDLGQEAKATKTLLKYVVHIGYRADESTRPTGSLELRREELVAILARKEKDALLFENSLEWKKSVLTGVRRSPYISTHGDTIKIHQDGVKGKPLSRRAHSLPRTVLSVSNAAENPTIMLARREMQSWRLMQLEPSALRKPDDFTAPAQLGDNGAHLAATIYRLTRQTTAEKTKSDAARIYARLANRLSELIENVRDIKIDRDEKRQLLTMLLTNAEGTTIPAQALSDGTLRFLALAAIELDAESMGVLCFEEPENGIHPKRIKAMLDLLQDIAVDTSEAVGEDNPMRQVIINTHSPAIAMGVPEDSLIFAKSIEKINERGERFNAVEFRALEKTWRTKAAEKTPSISMGDLLAYLNPIQTASSDENLTAQNGALDSRKSKKRVIDAIKEQLPLFDGQEK